ncbi:MAG: hypothetical protein NW226_19745 [Microscillaceae bacterium]|nr:hypothetical protein [Microscillaceae bacterium]
MNTRIISLLFVPVIAVLTWLLVSGVKGPIDQKTRISAIENAVVEKLKLLRDLQIAYQSENGIYAGKWEDLINFAENGKFFIVQTKERTKLLATGVEEVQVIQDTLGTVPVKDSLAKKYPNFDPKKLPIIPESGKKFTLFAGQVDNGGLLINVFEIRDEYPLNPDRGAEFRDAAKKNPFSITRLTKHFEDKLTAKREEATAIQRKMKNASEAEKKQLQNELDELSKFINLYEKRIEQLETKPLRVGSRIEATTAGNWE